MALGSGARLGPYEVQSLIGAGGMGEVYKARDTRLDRIVAIKVLPTEISIDSARRARFEREAKTIAALNHPHICTVYDVGDSDGSMFLVMEYIEGQTLAERLLKGPLPLDEALTIATDIAGALSAAHSLGIIHRDLKPANVMVTRDGHVKVLDFGLAKHVGPRFELQPEAATVGEPSDDSGLTQRGVLLGTVSYMSPEQVDGAALDARCDIFSFGAVLYEMLTAQRAFHGDSPISTMSAILRETPTHAGRLRADVPPALQTILNRCLHKQRELRYASAVTLHQELVVCQLQLTARKFGVWAILRKGRFAIPLFALAVLLIVAVSWSLRRSSQVTWARTVVLPQVNRLLDEGRSCAAFRLVARAEKYLPRDPEIQRIRQAFMRPASFISDPPGADVYIRDYIDTAADAAEDYLGRTPLEAVRIPAGHVRFRLSKPGWTSVEGYSASAITGAIQKVEVKLDPAGTGPQGMVRVPAQQRVEEFWLDKYEVTNRLFKEFVIAGAYEKTNYWKEPFIKGGAAVTWQHAMAEFRDATGRPGPATWRFGTFPDGQGDYPVDGVSWYEAVAYCASQGKALPTVRHWQIATLQGTFATILQTSNFGGTGPAPVGSRGGLGPFGTYDSAGNVREWCWNAVGDKRYILGGAWSDPKYMFYLSDASDPFDRAAVNGFRCARFARPLPNELTAPVDLFQASIRNLQPVSDEVFESYRAFHTYDRGELDAKLEATDDANPYWRLEKVSFRAAYGNERVTAYLFVPKNADPPFQTIITFPGTYALDIRNSARLETQWFDYIIRSGRAVMHPIYKGTYERTIGGTYASYIAQPKVFRDLSLAWYRDLGRSLDYLETRPGFDRQKVAYHGISLGAVTGPRMMALDSRLKTGVLLWGGVGWALPEVNAINFAPRSKAPTLMINGDADMLFPVENSQLPIFRLLGTPDPDKRRYVVKGAGHVAFNQDVIREVLGWLDKYLGPVKTR